MRLTFKGGVHPFEGKEMSKDCPVEKYLPKADLAYPLSQHIGAPAKPNIINLRLDITHLYYPAKNSFQKGRLKRREIFTELLLYTLTT